MPYKLIAAAISMSATFGLLLLIIALGWFSIESITNSGLFGPLIILASLYMVIGQPVFFLSRWMLKRVFSK